MTTWLETCQQQFGQAGKNFGAGPISLITLANKTGVDIPSDF